MQKKETCSAHYVGEDQGPAYVVNLKVMRWDMRRHAPPPPKEIDADMARMVQAEKAEHGNRQRSLLEVNAFEILDTLVGGEKAVRMFFYGVKQARNVGNLVIGLLGPGVGCAAAVRRMADTEFELHHNEVGLVIRSVCPSFSSYVVTSDLAVGVPHVAFVPRPS
jgi:hypothetical protein